MAALTRRTFACTPRHSFRQCTIHAHRSFSSYLVTPKELHEALQDQDLNDSAFSISPDGQEIPEVLQQPARIVPVCAAWFMPNDPEKRTGKSVFEEGHIPGARFFDLDLISDKTSKFPHMLPTRQVFKDEMSRMGITPHDRIVVYDTAELGIFSAPRVAWTFQSFGHDTVHVLNNFKVWYEKGFPVVAGVQERVAPSNYKRPRMMGGKAIDFERMKETVKKFGKGQGRTQILDARSHGRWAGTDPEPRAGLSSGHMPGSISIPFQEVLDPVWKTFLPPAQLRELFARKGVKEDRPTIATCGTGVTAVVLDAALHIAGMSPPKMAGARRRIYDGSWTEWAQRTAKTPGMIVKEEQNAAPESQS